MKEANSKNDVNADQILFWNSAVGTKWRDHQQELDACFAGIKTRLLEYAKIETGERVLDIGCGTGATTMEISEQLGPTGHVLAVDVSQIMLELAIDRAKQAERKNIEFLLADAQIHLFPTASFDLIISRFGVMFFDDPIAAFANLVKALRQGGRMVFVAWTALDKNPWFQIPKVAAIKQLGKPQLTMPHAPGPFAFDEADYVTDILSRAGLNDIRIQQEVVPLKPQGTIDDAARLACNLGPAMRIIKEKDGSDEDYKQIKNEVATAFETYSGASGVRIPATVHFISCE